MEQGSCCMRPKQIHVSQQIDITGHTVRYKPKSKKVYLHLGACQRHSDGRTDAEMSVIQASVRPSVLRCRDEISLSHNSLRTWPEL